MNIKVVILVDNGVRDLLSCRLLQEEFRKRGILATLCCKRTMKIVLRAVEPDVVIVPRGDLPYLRDLAQCSRLYVVPCEGGRLTLKTMMSVFLGRVHKGDVLSKGNRLDQFSNIISNFDFIRRVYLWGPQTYNFLKESNYFRPEQLKVAGSVKLDVYRNGTVKRKRTSQDDFVMGVAFSAKATSSFYGKVNYAEILYGFDEKSHLPMVPPGRHWEDYAWRDFAILRQMMNVIKRFLETTQGTVYLRIGPLENPNDYTFLTKFFPGRVRIQEDMGELYEFLTSIDVLLTCWSTTGIEAILCGVPVIATPSLMDREHLFRHVDPEANGFNTFLPCYHLPQSEEEVMGMMERARNHQLPLTPNEARFKDLLRDSYHWPTKESAAQTIVTDILEDVKNNFYPQQSSWAKVLPLPSMVNMPMNAMAFINKPGAFALLKKAYEVKFFIEDIQSHRLKGSQRHHMTKNPHVDAVIQMTQNGQ